MRRINNTLASQGDICARSCHIRLSVDEDLLADAAFEADLEAAIDSDVMALADA